MVVQSNASAIEVLTSFGHEWTSERLLHYKLDVLVALRDGTDPARIPSGAVDAVANFWEKLASLTQAEHIDARLVWNFGGGSCKWWRARLAPFVRRARAEGGEPRHYADSEWLAVVMAAMDRRAGVATTYDEEKLAKSPRGLVAVLCGACATVVGFAVWLRLTPNPDIGIESALIGIGLALVALSVGFAPVALIGWLAHRTRHGT